MKTKLDGQVAIVTGGSRGIGQSIAQLLTQRGAQVINWDRDPPLDDETSVNRPAHTEIVDVSSYDSVETAFKAAEKQFGQIHILINNAGINGPIIPTWEYPLEDWERVIAINLTSVFYTSRLAAVHMRRHGYGRILTISSIAGKEGVVNLCAYSAAKAGVIGFSKALSKEAMRGWHHGELHRTGDDGYAATGRHDRRAYCKHESKDPHGPVRPG